MLRHFLFNFCSFIFILKHFRVAVFLLCVKNTLIVRRLLVFFFSLHRFKPLNVILCGFSSCCDSCCLLRVTSFNLFFIAFNPLKRFSCGFLLTFVHFVARWLMVFSLDLHPGRVLHV